MDGVELPDVDILSRPQAKGLLRRVALQQPRTQVPHLVSISDPEDGPPEEVKEHPGRLLILEFDDHSDPAPGITLPKIRDVEQIVKFADEVGPGEYVLCHCNAGISRSSAAAMTILATKLGNTRQAAMDAVTRVLGIKNMIHPNRLMVEYADEILGFGGALVEAHAATFLGQGIFIP